MACAQMFTSVCMPAGRGKVGRKQTTHSEGGLGLCTIKSIQFYLQVINEYTSDLIDFRRLFLVGVLCNQSNLEGSRMEMGS